ncbi:MAG: hypothetical protein Q4A11_04415 [Brachymonas sp.]|nr:hypothetical protein [Brachymonas sp.]
MNKTVLSICTALLMLAAAPVGAAQPPSDHDLGQAMQTYYKRPDPARALLIMQRLLASPGYKQQSSQTILSNYWGAAVLQRHPAQTMTWCQAVQQHDAQTQLYASSLFFMAQTPDMEQCLQSLSLSAQQRQQLLSQQPAQPLQQAITHPLHLDLLWAHFFATGHAQAVLKIADYAVANREVLTEQIEHPTMLDARRLLLEQAARWSLHSNAQQDPHVRQILVRHAQTLQAAERSWLEQNVLSSSPDKRRTRPRPSKKH